MKPIFLSMLAVYIVFIVVDIICCPSLYSKIFYRACFDILKDENNAEATALYIAKDFVRYIMFIPIVHIVIFIVAFSGGTLYAFEKIVYPKFMANKDFVFDSFNELSK